jgi:hypothetical protein
MSIAVTTTFTISPPSRGCVSAGKARVGGAGLA